MEDAQEMICPSCGYDDNHVSTSRHMDNGIRRYRECFHCGEKFVTMERLKGDVRPLKPMAENVSAIAREVGVSSPTVRTYLRTGKMRNEYAARQIDKIVRRKTCIAMAKLINRKEPVWIEGTYSGWAIISDAECGDLYVYTKDGGMWLSKEDFNKSWWAYETE